MFCNSLDEEKLQTTIAARYPDRNVVAHIGHEYTGLYLAFGLVDNISFCAKFPPETFKKLSVDEVADFVDQIVRRRL